MTESASGRTVYAVVVAYKPDMNRLAALLRAVASQVSGVVIVDNGGEAAQIQRLVHSQSLQSCTVVGMSTNIGVAGAQNEGLRISTSAGADYVVLFDHDSVPDAGMIARLLGALESEIRKGRQVAAAGPAFSEERSATSSSYFVRFGLFGRQRIYCRNANEGVIPADILISSGMLIPVNALAEVGLMDDAFFIDHVDTEWCLRARSRGYGLIGVCGARMSHQLGDSSTRLIGGRRVFMHNATRRYFMFRNSVLLYRRDYPPLRWKIADALRMVGLMAAILLLSLRKREQLRAAFLGIHDGLRGRSGPLPESSTGRIS
jgi:rhamnosyltransferase